MILDEINTSVLNGDLTLAQELELKKMTDDPKNSTTQSCLLKLVVNKNSTISDVSNIFCKVVKYLPETTMVTVSTDVDDTLTRAESYLKIVLSDTKTEFSDVQ